MCCIADVFAPVCSRTFIVPPFGVCMFFRKEREIQELTVELRSMGVPLGGEGMVMDIGGRYAYFFFIFHVVCIYVCTQGV